MNILKFNSDEDFVQTGANLIASLLHSNPKRCSV